MDWQSNRRQFQIALTWGAAALLIWVVWEARIAVLIAFGSVLAAILLGSLASIIAARIHVPDKAGLALATLFLIAVTGVALWLFGSQLASQFSGVLKQVQATQQHLQTTMTQDGASQFGSAVARKATSFVTGMATDIAQVGFRFVEGGVVLVITAIYLAAQPRLYSRGVAAMFAPASRPRVNETAVLIETTLR